MYLKIVGGYLLFFYLLKVILQKVHSLHQKLVFTLIAEYCSVFFFIIIISLERFSYYHVVSADNYDLKKEWNLAGQEFCR